MEPTFWNLISMSLMILFAYPWLRFALSRDPIYLWMGMGIVLADLSTKVIKQLTKNFGEAFVRPAGAKDCDIMCTDGDRAGSPAFVSGHTTDVAFFFTYLYLISSPSHRPVIVILGLLASSLYMGARTQKRCHTMMQSLVGLVYGAVFAVIWFQISVKYIHTPDQHGNGN